MWYCKCGKDNYDTQDTCWNCGEKRGNLSVTENINSEQTLNFSETQMHDSNKKGDNILVFAMQVIFCLAGIVSGIVSIAMVGTRHFGYDTYRRAQDMSFGADFYTEIYGATRVAANNLYSIVNALTDMANALFVFAGIFAIAYFGLKLFKIIEARMK